MSHVTTSDFAVALRLRLDMQALAADQPRKVLSRIFRSIDFPWFPARISSSGDRSLAQ